MECSLRAARADLLAAVDSVLDPSPASRAAGPARRAYQSHDHWRCSVPENSCQRVFPGEESQLAVMRKWLADLLPASPQRDDLAVVATELGTNAIRHTASGVGGGQFIVEVTWHPALVRVAVTDGGAPAGPRIISDPLGECGRGLLVVQGLSVLMGITGNPGGRQVWAHIPPDKAAVAEPASPCAADEAIQADLADLTSRFPRIPVWFGQVTQQWWALTCGQLVTATTVRGLAERLSQQPSAPARHTVPGTERRALPTAQRRGTRGCGTRGARQFSRRSLRSRSCGLVAPVATPGAPSASPRIGHVGRSVPACSATM